MSELREISGIISIITGAVLMGSVAIFIRNIHMNPIHISFFRFLFGFIFLSLVIISSHRRFSLKDPKLLFIISILNVSLVTFYIAAIQRIPAGMAALLLYMAPVYVIPIAYFTGEEISPKVFVSLPLSLIGLFLMLMPAGRIDPGMIFGFLSGVSYALYFFVIKRLRKEMQSLEVTAIYLGISSLILLPGLFIVPATRFDFGWLIGLGLIPTAIAFTLFNFGIKYCKITEGPLFALAEPVSASIFGFLVFKESFSQIQTFGVILILLGVSIAIKKV